MLGRIHISDGLDDLRDDQVVSSGRGKHNNSRLA